VTTELYLVRHGETDWNRQRRIQGLTDIALNDAGREQARATGRRLATRTWDGVYTSPLSRAFETAEIIAAELGLPEPTPVDALVERNYGDAEGLDFAQVDRRWPERGDVPGQETREEVVARVLPALRSLAAEHAGESLVVVSHGGAIRAVLTAVQPDASHGMITNGSIHSFRFGDELELIAFDDPLTEGLDEQNAVEAREEGVA
jgi:broad specificity phosphatase PhoE